MLVPVSLWWAIPAVLAAPPSGATAASLWDLTGFAPPTIWLDKTGAAAVGTLTGREDGADDLARARAARDACRPPGIVRPLGELPNGMDLPGWPEARELAEVASWDLGCPSELKLSALVLTRYRGSSGWRVIEVVDGAGLARWSAWLEQNGAVPSKPAVEDPSAVSAPAAGLVVHWSEVQAKRIVKPKSIGVEGRCTVRITLDAKGIPTDVLPGACAPEFFAVTEPAVRESRWYPVKRAGVAVPVTFAMNYQFVMD